MEKIDLRNNTNAEDWAEAFCRLHPQIDRKMMISWFYNAIEAGYEQAALEVENIFKKEQAKWKASL
jgi:hypothetical protein